jgi:nicotinamidase-related amidase
MKSKTALLVMDVQVAPVALHADEAYAPNLARAIGAARAAGLTVIFVKAEFRPRLPRSQCTQPRLFGHRGGRRTVRR